jgi:hypothetical protein
MHSHQLGGACILFAREIQKVKEKRKKKNSIKVFKKREKKKRK